MPEHKSCAGVAWKLVSGKTAEAIRWRGSRSL
jgi:hypothetical protein